MPACTTPELWLVWWAPTRGSFSQTTTEPSGRREASSRATARPTMPAPTTPNVSATSRTVTRQGGASWFVRVRAQAGSAEGQPGADHAGQGSEQHPGAQQRLAADRPEGPDGDHARDAGQHVQPDLGVLLLGDDRGDREAGGEVLDHGEGQHREDPLLDLGDRHAPV